MIFTYPTISLTVNVTTTYINKKYKNNYKYKNKKQKTNILKITGVTF